MTNIQFRQRIFAAAGAAVLAIGAAGSALAVSVWSGAAAAETCPNPDNETFVQGRITAWRSRRSARRLRPAASLSSCMATFRAAVRSARRESLAHLPVSGPLGSQ